MKPLILFAALAIAANSFAADDLLNFEKPAWWKTPSAPALTRGKNWAETVRLSFPDRWARLEYIQVVGAFAAPDGKNFSTEFGPEKSPFDPAAKFGSELAWRSVPTAWENAAEAHDLSLFDRKENAAAYVYAEFQSPKAEIMALVGGSDDTFTLWVNGKKLVEHEVYRGSSAEQERVEFKSLPGKNTLLLKVCQGILGWNFFLDARRPFKQSRHARTRELAALIGAHPDDEYNGWKAALEIADTLRSESLSAEADSIVAHFSEGQPADAWPESKEPLLKKGDSLIIVGDSITQQRRYTRLMEDYLRACQPGLLLDIRQSGWDGQKTADLLPRLEQDVLAFKPSVVLDCYGANDTLWDAYGPAAVELYKKNTAELAARLKKAAVRLVISGTSCAVAGPNWRKNKLVGPLTTNRTLADLRLHGVEIAGKLGLPFIDVFPSMIHAAERGIREHGGGFMLSGDDGVHPEWSGHLVLATSRVMGLGVDGNLGDIEIDMAKGSHATVEGEGHLMVESGPGWANLISTRYPFCVGKGPASDHHSWAAGARLSPFHEKLNRLTLRVKNAGNGRLRLKWGGRKKIVDSAQLEAGVNLAELFEDDNPFSKNFEAMDEAVGKKQEFETHELHDILHGPLKGQDLKDAVAAAEAERALLSKAVDEALRPVRHEIRVETLN